MKKRKEYTIAQSFALSLIVPGVILATLLVSGGLLFTLASQLENKVLLIVGIVVVGILAIAYILFSIIAFIKLRNTYQDGLYKTTAALLRGLKSNVPTTENFPETTIKEINELRSELAEVNTMTANSTMISNDLSSSYIPLNYISSEDNLVTLESFKAELRSLIYCSQNYRNAIVEAFYDLDDDEIINSKMEKNELKYPIDIVKGSSKKYNEYK